MKYSLKQLEFMCEIAQQTSVDKLREWCKSHTSNGRFAYSPGNRYVALDPSTFLPISESTHKFLFDIEEDRTLFLLRWA